MQAHVDRPERATDGQDVMQVGLHHDRWFVSAIHVRNDTFLHQEEADEDVVENVSTREC